MAAGDVQRNVKVIVDLISRGNFNKVVTQLNNYSKNITSLQTSGSKLHRLGAQQDVQDAARVKMFDMQMDRIKRIQRTQATHRKEMENNYSKNITSLQTSGSKLHRLGAQQDVQDAARVKMFERCLTCRWIE